MGAINHNLSDHIELTYLRNTCDIQDKYIKGQMTFKEMNEKLEIERCKYINSLRILKASLDEVVRQEESIKLVFEALKENYGTLDN